MLTSEVSPGQWSPLQLASDREELSTNQRCLEGSASLLFAIGSNSQWFAVMNPGTVNSMVFSVFMKLLEKILDETEVIERTSPMVIIDNAKIHTSRFTKAVIKCLKLDVKPLPLYCPEVAPMELVLGRLKQSCVLDLKPNLLILTKGLEQKY